MPLPTDDQMFFEHVLQAKPCSARAPKRRVTPQRVYELVRQYKREHITRIELDLMAARKTDQLLVLAVPPQAAESQALAVRYLDFVTRELERRGVDTEVHYRALPDGAVAFLLEDVTDYSRGKKT